MKKDKSITNKQLRITSNDRNSQSVIRNSKIPELRFPEFKNDGEWEVVEVGEVFEVTRGNVLSMNLVKENQSKENPYPVFSSQTKNNGLAGFYNEFLYKNAITWTTDGANAGDVNYREGKFYCTNVCGVLINKKGFANKCISELINSVSKNHVSYVGNPKLMNGVMSKIKIPFPSLKEQQKIASTLSSLDEVIEVHKQKLELLKEHKKGLMQNLFPQEGQKVPNYRFPEFINDGEWVEKKLGEVAEFSKGKGISKADIIENGTLPCIRYGELYTHYKETINDVISRTNIPTKDLVLSQENDVIIPSSGETQIDIATASCVMKSGIALGGDLNIIRTDINGVFLSYYLNNAKKKEIAQMAQGISVVHLYSSQLKDLVIQTPTIEEQQKIASCLSSLDEIIQVQGEKIEQLKQHKKGLMQGLFPEIND